jgi:uncharacterized protein
VPLLESSFSPPVYLRSGHLQTLCGRLIQESPEPSYARERLSTPDGDFVDLDWLRCGASKVALLCHGLEGSSQSGYLKRMSLALFEHKWDVVALNYRGCGGEPNRLVRSYHSGFTDDVHLVVKTLLEGKQPYEKISLIGFSIGGNIVLKYLGESGNSLLHKIHSAVAFSVPCDLAESATVMERITRRLYLKQFLSIFDKKLLEKRALFPKDECLVPSRKIKNFFDYDTLFTAPLHGFSSAKEYWEAASSRRVLSSISCRTLLVNALDDPFYGPKSIPTEEAKNHSTLFLETPKNGGHVGFVTPDSLKNWRAWWPLQRTMSFIME